MRLRATATSSQAQAANESLWDARDRTDADRFGAIVQWLQENNPRALELCPYKVEKPLHCQSNPKGASMSDVAQKAIDVLAEIAEDTNADNDTRIRAACAILGHAESVRQGHTAPV